MNTKKLKSFKMNNKVAVKLSEEGHRILKEYYNYKGDKEYLEQYVELDGDVLQIELWKLMQIFRSEMYNGNENIPFKSRNMLISDADLTVVKTTLKGKENENR